MILRDHIYDFQVTPSVSHKVLHCEPEISKAFNADRKSSWLNSPIAGFAFAADVLNCRFIVTPDVSFRERVRRSAEQRQFRTLPDDPHLSKQHVQS